jgi:hypothetical protein
MNDITEVKIECFGPHAAMAPITRALAEAGFGRVGLYDHCFAITTISGSFRPLAGANPHTGEVGRVRYGTEGKLEFNCAAEQAAAAVAVIRAAHPYEEPVINVVPLWNGRCGATV